MLPVVSVTSKDPSAECWLVVYDEALNNYRSLFTDSPKNLHQKGQKLYRPLPWGRQKGTKECSVFEPRTTIGSERFSC